jgi:hypothetical protein
VRVDRRRRLAVGACHKMALATKPLPQRGEAIPKQSGAYRCLATQGMANMQFIMNLIWDLSRSSSMAAVSQERHR